MSFYQQSTIFYLRFIFVSPVLHYIFILCIHFPEHLIGANYYLVSKETESWVA